MMRSLQQRWQHWWSAIQHWIAGRWPLSADAPSQVSADEAIAAPTTTPSSALLIHLASRSRRRNDTRDHCRTNISARAWHSEQRVIDLLAYHAARHSGGLTPVQMQQRLNNIRAHTPD